MSELLINLFILHPSLQLPRFGVHVILVAPSQYDFLLAVWTSTLKIGLPETMMPQGSGMADVLAEVTTMDRSHDRSSGL